MIRLRPSGADEVLIKRVRDWYEPGPGVFIAPQALFNPVLLFTTGVNGTWYDPSDFTTLFQDAAGTTPVTAVEQPVGLMLDKSKGLVLGSELVTSYDFTTWTTAGTVSGVTATAFTSTGGAGVYKALSLTAGKFYRVRVIGTTSVVGGVTIRNTGDTVGSYTITTATFDVTMSLGWGSQPNLYIKNENSGTTTITSISVRELPGNHAFNASGNSANFPVLKEDATGRKYLSFNGTNQWLQTNSIDFSYGDKMFVSAGVRKLSDAARAVVVELGIAQASSLFRIEAPTSASGNNYNFATGGSTPVPVVALTFTAPITNIVSGIGDISAPSAVIRVNGTQSAQSTASQGTGNYGNYPLYIGARGGSSLWFHGRLYQLVVAGKQASASEIGQTEAFVNQKTGAY